MANLIHSEVTSSGIHRMFYNDNNTIIEKAVCDVTPVLTVNKEMQNTAGYGTTKDKSMRHVASIPLIVLEQWIREYGVNPLDPQHDKLLKRLLNDPDNLFLRTTNGVV